MRRTARVFMTNRSQAVRLPKEFQFSTHEVFIRKLGLKLVTNNTAELGRVRGLQVESWTAPARRPR